MTRDEQLKWMEERARKNKAEGRVETPPEFTEEDDRAMDAVFAQIGADRAREAGSPRPAASKV